MATTYAKKLNQQTSIANSELDPAYNTKVNALKNSLAASKLALNSQREGVNQNYDTQVTNQNINNEASKDNYSDITTSRGVGRSSIATTGLAEKDQINNRYVNAINQNRTGALGGIDSDITLAETEYNANVSNLGADKMTQANDLAHNYADKEVAQEYQAGRDAVADNQWTATNNYNIGRDRVADSHYNSDKATDNARYNTSSRLAAQAVATDNSRYNTSSRLAAEAVKTDNSRYNSSAELARTAVSTDNSRYNSAAKIAAQAVKTANSRYAAALKLKSK